MKRIKMPCGCFKYESTQEEIDETRRLTDADPEIAQWYRELCESFKKTVEIMETDPEYRKWVAEMVAHKCED